MTGMTNVATRESLNSELSWKGMTVGLDLSDNYSSVCVLSSDGEIVEEARLRTTTTAIAQRFETAAMCRIVLEVGTHSPWVSRLLSSFGHEVIVANPRRVRLIADSSQKTDRSDAETLARLGRIDPAFLSPIVHRPEQAQIDLAIVRARHALVGARSSLINHVRGAVKSTGARLPACDAYMFHRKVAALIPSGLEVALAPILQTIGDLTRRIKEVDRTIVSLIQERYPEAQFLQQVPGVGPLISLTFVLTIGDPSRFSKSRQVGPYLGLVPRRRDSGEKSPQLGISKTGNSYLRNLLVNGSQYILGYRGADSDLRRWGLEHASVGGKSGRKRAVVAVARKLAVLLHRLWVTGEMYVPLRSEGAAIV
jgi:transposase